MKNIGSRALALVLALVMLFATMCVAPVANAQMEGYLTYVVEEGKVTITDCETHAKTIVVPEKIGEYPVVAIGQNAFADCTALTSVTIPASVTDINASAFSGCSALTTVNIPTAVTKIGDLAFKDCISLTKIEFPKTISDIGYGAFSGCSALSDINFENTIVTIGDWAFYNCASLTKVTIAESITKIGYNTFAGCAGITEIKIHEKVTDIDAGAFAGCTSLKKVELKDGLNTIGAGAFKGCAIEEIVVPKTVTKIDAGAFENCSALAKVTLNKGLKEIGKEAFKNCTKLESFELPRTLETVNERVFEGCTSLKNFVYALDATSVSKGMFKDCTALEKIELPKRITSIGEKAFYGCTALKDITFKKNVKTIGEQAFYGCDALVVNYKALKGYFDLIDVKDNNENLKNATINYVPDPEVKIVDTSKVFKDIVLVEKEDENFNIVTTKEWYKDFVDYAYSHGIFVGKDNGNFEPNSNITRAEFVQVLANLSLIDTKNKVVKSEFKDVPSGEWYAPAVMWAYQNEIVVGMGDGVFAPNQNITREQMCLMLVNYVENYLMSTLNKSVAEPVVFADEATISSWASEAVTKCVEAGIVVGDENKNFAPQNSATRAHVATIFTNFNKQYNEILPY